MTRQRWAYLQLTGAMVTAGSSFVAGDVVTGHVPIFLASALRYGVASAVMVPLLVRQEGGLPRVERREFGVLFALAMTGIVGFNIFLLYGLRYTTAGQSGIIAGMTPAVVGVLAMVMLRERPRVRNLAAIGLAVAGMVAITLAGEGGGGSPESAPLVGNLLVCGAVLCEAMFSTLGKSLAMRVRALSIATWIAGIGFAVFLPFAVVQGWGFDAGSVSMRVWLGVAYYAVLATVVPYLLWYDALRWVPASTAGVFTGVMPVSAVVLSAVVLGEALSAAHLTGMVCVLAALGLTVVEPRRPIADDLVAPGAVRARG